MNITQIFPIQPKKQETKATNSVEKPNWQDISLTNNNEHQAKIFNEIKLKQPLLGDIFVSMNKDTESYHDNRFIIKIKNKLGKVFGEEILDIKESNKNIFGYSILVLPEYRQKSFRFGELMRLASIMELMENKGKEIKIYSKDVAVYFHSKYKFKPDIIQFETREKCLQSVASDKDKEFKPLAQKAEALLKTIKASNKNNYTEQMILTKTANQLIKDYIDLALKSEKPEKKHPFNWGMNMVLTQNDILENKDFFNELFKKHGIDYTI